tara:strand:- start:175 stop:975 length:801 start_codon:yes stop_codon:yes gene_type:complete
MINVVDIYNSVRDLCNKDQKGFVTPEVFTTFAGIAQQNVFNEMFTEFATAKKARRSAIDPARDKSLYKQVQEDLAYFIREVELSDANIVDAVDETDLDGNVISTTPAYDASDVDVSVFDKPSDLSKIISMRTIAPEAQAQLELVYNPEDIDRIISSNLSTPTSEFPVALISDRIHIFPEDVNSVKLMYYRQPRSIRPTTGNVDLNSTPVYQDLGGSITIPDLANCRHFELPEHYKNEVIMEIAKMIGIRLRDSYLTTISMQEEKAE